MSALIVYDHGGPPLAYVLPPWQARACLAVYIPRPEQLDPADEALLRGLGIHTSLDADCWDRRNDHETTRRIVAAARDHGADALVTFSELSAVPTARAAAQLGLRGATAAGAERARDKLLMRDALRAAGFRTPRYRAVAGPADVAQALADFRGPLLLKPRCGMSAVGIQRVEQAADVEAAFASARASLGDFPILADTEQAFLVEQVLVGDPSAWYSGPGLSDQVCVEGLVVEGRYVPVAITDVTPKVAPLTQSGHISPTSLSAQGQSRVINAARRAVDALDLSTCGTHVELMLMPDGDCAVIEIAARYPGRTVVPQTDYAYGSDLVGALADALLHGHTTAAPFRAGHAPSRAAATVHLYASEYLRRLEIASFSYAGVRPLAHLIDPSVRIASYRARPAGWPMKRHAHEQPHWLAQLYLEGASLHAVRQSVDRVRRDFQLMTSCV